MGARRGYSQSWYGKRKKPSCSAEAGSTTMMDPDMKTALVPRLAGAAEHYNFLQWGIVIAFSVTFLFATIALGLRSFQAIKLTKKVELDHIVVTISYGVALTYFVTMHTLMNYGWGKHIWEVPMEDLVEFNKALLPNTMTYLICPSVTKMAALSVLWRINPSKGYRATVVLVAVAIFIYTLVLCVITGAPCNPLKSGTTMCLMNVALSHAVLNIVSDFAVIITPIPTIYNLHLTTKQKISLGALMALGSAVVVCSIARLPYVIQMSTTPDVTYTEAILGVWSIVEVNLGVICACAMRLKPLAVRYFPAMGLFSSHPRSQATHPKLASAPWAGNSSERSRGQHSYHLHSIQKSSADPIDKKEIHVYREFNLDVESKGTQEDGSSTHKMLD
ncbi:hypothetical protein F4779DRAFT_607738 [Xylariaceae sp. FL0662B]|nr:hypothetical protein F4779DRAFT_607738 [Xylariaceae sp. FL0662B]